MKRRFLLLLTGGLVLFCACAKSAVAQTAEPMLSPVIVQAEVKLEDTLSTSQQEAVPTPLPAEESKAANNNTDAEAEPESAPEPTNAPEEKTVVRNVTDEQLDEGYLDSFFKDSVLVGDSLVAGLSGYVLSEQQAGKMCLGEMQLVSASALTLKKAMEAEQGLRGHELRLRNRYMSVTEVVTALESKKLFLMLGVSDPRWYSGEELVAAYDTLISIVKTTHPDIEIYIHSIMPMVKDYARQVQIPSEVNRAVNETLEQYCKENGYTFIQLADLVRDEEGYLVYEYSAGDYRFHLNKKGKIIWVRCLREIARNAYYEGTWNPEGN